MIGRTSSHGVLAFLNVNKFYFSLKTYYFIERDRSPNVLNKYFK